MAVTAKWYGLGLAGCFGGTAAAGTAVDYLSDTIKVSLHLDYTPNQDTHSLWSDVSGTEIAATGGYSAGGSTLLSKTLDYTAGTNVIKFDGADQTYATSTIAATQAVVYDASIAGSVLLGYVDFGGTVSSTSGNWTITWDAAGIFTVTPA